MSERYGLTVLIDGRLEGARQQTYRMPLLGNRSWKTTNSQDKRLALPLTHRRSQPEASAHVPYSEDEHLKIILYIPVPKFLRKLCKFS